LQVDDNNAHIVKGHFEGENVNLAEDFVATYELDRSDLDKEEVLTYRKPVSGQPSPAESIAEPHKSEPGFFEVEALLGYGKGPAPGAAGSDATAAKTIVVLFDTSLSMQWEKLERSYQALENLLHSLRPADRFNLVLFNNQAQAFQASLAVGDSASIQSALDFVRSSRLRGGTNLQDALNAGLQQCKSAGSGNPYLVLLSDGGATRGPILSQKIASWYSHEWNQLPATQRPRTYILAMGDDANMPLLGLLARQDGLLERVLSTEPLDFKLASFLSKIGRTPIGQLRLAIAPQSATNLVYPLQDSAFSGSLALWVGQYQKPQENVALTVNGERDGAPLNITAKSSLPRESLDHPQLPRLWARARVDALLEKIAREGEDQASIDEIIRLARQYKFVTPYTSFLAVPRALLRPRVIRPGDPVLRVKTDESIVSVVALFPFGLVQKLRYLSDEDTWQTRFLAPDEMQDGTYTVRLILRDRQGRAYRESKTFVIASKPPVVHVKVDRERYRRGEIVNLNVRASQNTRTLIARLEGVSPVGLRWDQHARVNTGQLLIPDQMIPGTYTLTVTAEDIAHNIGTQEVRIEVLP